MYSVVAGDTFELISRKQYGTEQYAGNIQQANPGANEPLQAGTELIIPDNLNVSNNPGQITEAVNPDEVGILIDDQRFRYWFSVSIFRSIDAVDTLELMAPFEPDLPYFKDTFRPFSYKSVDVTVGGEPLFKGTMITVLPSLSDRKAVQVSAYSTPGVLNDCTAPASAYPLEYNNQTLKGIADSIIQPFGIKSVFIEGQSSVFERVAMQPSQKILDFLSTLAKQKNLVIASTERGELLFHKSITSGTPVARLRQGSSPLISVTPTFNPQEYFSHVTGIEPIVVGLKGEAYTVKNGKLNNLLRPYTFEAQDTESGTLKEAVDAKAGRMFGNMVSYRVVLSTWRDPQGNLWKPNTIINLQASNAMIYDPYDFVIRSIEFNRNEKTQTATLDLVIPGSFSGKIPEALPWD